VDITVVLIRFLVAVPIAAILLAAFRFVTDGYGKSESTAVTPEPAPDAEKPSP